MSRKRIAVLFPLVLVAIYIFLDVWDVTPGFLTLQEPENRARSYPQVVMQKTQKVVHGQKIKTQIPDKVAVQEIVNKLQNDSRMPGKVSAIVIDADSETVLGQIDTTRLVTPASTNKLLTAAAVLSAYGANHQFSTGVKLADRDLFLVGGGDVLLAPDKGNQRTVVGRAGLADLAKITADKLKAKEISEVTLHLDTSLFISPKYASTWQSWAPSWVMENSPIAVDRNRQETQISQPNPATFAQTNFARNLSALGIKVRVSAPQSAPENARKIAAVKSAPLREVLHIMLADSDNSLAETMAHLVAVKRGEVANFTGASKAVVAQLKAAGYDTANSSLVDGSGLSQQNKITVKFLADILQEVWNGEEESLHSISASLPVAHLDGTLEPRFSDTILQGKVRAKTGTLDNVVALAGFMNTELGRPLIFAIIVDDLPEGNISLVRKLIDQALVDIAKL